MSARAEGIPVCDWCGAEIEGDGLTRHDGARTWIYCDENCATDDVRDFQAKHGGYLTIGTDGLLVITGPGYTGM